MWQAWGLVGPGLGWGLGFRDNGNKMETIRGYRDYVRLIGIV